jgi:UTP-glucose-1-phosphate uridylyltransferase
VQKSVVQEPFAVINADDFYGKDGFAKAAQFLTERCDENNYAIIGYELAKTLSDHGTVSRGVCEVDDKGVLIEINERTKIYRSGDQIIYERK